VARINVEDSLYTDPRFRALTRKVGCEDKALGMCIRLWRLAQSHWAKGGMIPPEDFELEDLDIMLTVRLAEKRQGYIYARGSEEHFDWYRQRVEASKKGVAKRQLQNLGEPEQQKNDSPVNPPALTLALTHINTSPSSDDDVPKAKAKRAKTPSLGTNEFLASYSELYQDRYRTKPVIGPKIASIAKRIIREVGLDQAKALLPVFVKSDHPYAVQRGHDLVAMEQNLQALSLKLSAPPPPQLRLAADILREQREEDERRTDAIMAEREAQRAEALAKGLPDPFPPRTGMTLTERFKAAFRKEQEAS
jgi:hypothetical protein